MKLKEIAPIIKKELIYKNYCMIVKKPKKYTQITRNKMFDEIIKTYNDPKNIQEILTFKEAKMLQKALKNNNQIKDSQHKTGRSLYQKMLLLPDFNQLNDILYIPEELNSSIKEAVQTIDLNILKQHDRLTELIHGLIMVYGIIDIKDFINIILSYYPNQNYDDIYNYLTSTKNINHIISIKNNKIEAYDYSLENIGNEIIELQKSYPIYDYKIYSENEIRNIAQGKYSHPSYKAFIKFIDKNLNYYEKEILIRNFIFCINTVCDPDSFCDWLHENFNHNNIDLDKLCELFIEAYFNYPCAVVYGQIFSELITSHENYQSMAIQTNASLNEKDCKLFFKVYLGLLEYTNKKMHITNIKKIYKKENLPVEKLIKIRNSLYNNLNIIDSFIKDNPFNFNNDELSIVKQFKNGIIRDFIIIEHRPNSTIVADDHNNFYKIKGLTSNIDEVISAPAIANMLLLPFKNIIIYDGLINVYPIQIPPQIRGTLKNAQIKETLD